MRTYRQLFRVPEFRPLFLAVSAQIAATTVNGLALGTLVYSALLIGAALQQRLVDLTPAQMRGQALGLHSSGMLSMQAVAATLAGTVAQYLPTGVAMSVMATLSLLVTLLLRPGLRAPADTRTPDPAPA